MPKPTANHLRLVVDNSQDSDPTRPNYKRRRRVGTAIAMLGLSWALIQQNGGLEQVKENVRTFPSHVEGIINPPNPPANPSEK
jgi:hypothetical protein